MPPAYHHTVNTDQATFLGFGLEGIAYGANVVLFATTVVVLLRRAKKASTVAILALTCFLFSLCTVHYSLNFNNVYNGTMVHARPHISEETHLLAGADMIFAITDFCSQLILIYRCYLVWGRTIWVVVLPLLVAFASVGAWNLVYLYDSSCLCAACGLALIGLVLSISPTAPQAPAAIVPVGDAAFAMSLILNFMVSSLIVGRIWWVTRISRRLQGIHRHSTNSIQKAVGIIIESGLLFLSAQFVFVVLFATAHPAQAVVEPVATQIYATAPMLIIVRVGMGAAFEQTNPTAMNTSLRFNTKAGTNTIQTLQTRLSQDVALSEGDSPRGTVVDFGADSRSVNRMDVSPREHTV
ncbi:hypothetical protein GGX14DRAFT_381918 [Mycena pura]|uniref:Uncharacterized protein n=1 Tax=Mycena pura TaxID=153505 RepID=A0AAD6XYF4_9AGAR|nr:hypothetical protein GGX14DRAFT_381918 [Mycena pura]